jgi:hypothetical protein
MFLFPAFLLDSSFCLTTPENRILLTHNCDDFEELHQANPSHSRIFAVYRNANLLKNMGFKAIVKAIANLETANVPLANQFISLNHWNY